MAKKNETQAGMTMDLEPHWPGMFNFVISIVRKELDEGQGRAIVTEMLEFGKRLYEKQEQASHIKQAAPELLAALIEVTADIEAYCEDHNSDHPTDVTVVLPKLQAAIRKAMRG